MLFGKKKDEKKVAKDEKPDKKAKADKAVAKPQPALKDVGPKPLSASQVREKLQEGWTKVFITFEIAGKPKEHIEQTLRAYMANIRQDSRFLSLSEEYAEAIEHEDGVFSAFVEVEALVETLETLTWIAINFMPASIEVLEPEEIALEPRLVTNWYNDLLAKLHEVSAAMRESKAVSTHITEGMNALIKNSILASLRSGERSGKELEQWLGIKEEQLEPFLKHLADKKQIVKKGQKYALP